MAALELYYFNPNVVQTLKMIAVKIVKWIIHWKNTLCWPCEGCKVSCRFFFSFPPISSWTEWCHINTAWLPSILFQMNYYTLNLYLTRPKQLKSVIFIFWSCKVKTIQPCRFGRRIQFWLLLIPRAWLLSARIFMTANFDFKCVWFCLLVHVNVFQSYMYTKNYKSTSLWSGFSNWWCCPSDTFLSSR